VNSYERWNMYYEVQSLKQLGLKVSQIARKLGISRNTVYVYLDATPEEIERLNQDGQTRKKKLNEYEPQILEWLKKYSDLSAAQVRDWIEEQTNAPITVSEGTVRNYVRYLRQEHDIPKIVHKRDHEAIEDPPMGQQAQMDFGEKKLLDACGKPVRLWFVAFVLSNSRYKYVEWLARPFTTRDVVQAHENAFEYFGGMPKEIVYDQDHLILVSENHGDLILTKEFARYNAMRKFKIYMCRKQDPQSKGRIENVVGYVKKNFAKNRVYYHIDKLNEQCQAWLIRTGNGKVHNTIKKIPAEVFSEERKYLKPVTEKITQNSPTGSISVTVRKNNIIVYNGNRYSVPLGTYSSPQSHVYLDLSEAGMLKILDPKTETLIARHSICNGKGQLIKNNDHKRDKSSKIQELINQVAEQFPNLPGWRSFLEGIRNAKPRYIRDQLQLIQTTINGIDEGFVTQALNFCVKNKRFSACDFSDAVEHFRQNVILINPNFVPVEIKAIDPEYSYKRLIRPAVRSLACYKLH
jgi:transposase